MSFCAVFMKLDRGPLCKAEVLRARPAKAGWDHGEIFFGSLELGRKGKKESKETEQRASYATWPLAARAVSTTNHYRISYDSTKTEKTHAT
jgi:hypothetical protein